MTVALWIAVALFIVAWLERVMQCQIWKKDYVTLLDAHYDETKRLADALKEKERARLDMRDNFLELSSNYQMLVDQIADRNAKIKERDQEIERLKKWDNLYASAHDAMSKTVLDLTFKLRTCEAAHQKAVDERRKAAQPGKRSHKKGGV